MKCDPGHSHDLILVHRDNLGVPENPYNPYGNIFLENKIINGEDIPHRAFGAYRHYFYKYQDQYEYFIFVSDDVVFKSDNWLKKILDTLNLHERWDSGHLKYSMGIKISTRESFKSTILVCKN